MKTCIALATATVATFLLAHGAFAQTNDGQRLLPASELKGADVKNLQDEELGDIDEVLIDPGSGKARFAVIGVGGFLGIGETNVAVPWEALHVSREGDDVKYVLNATKEKLEKAPRVEGKRYDRLYSRSDAEPTFVYWGVTWYDLAPLPSASPTGSAKAGQSPRATPADSKQSPSPTATPRATATPSPGTAGSSKPAPGLSPVATHSETPPPQ